MAQLVVSTIAAAAATAIGLPPGVGFTFGKPLLVAAPPGGEATPQHQPGGQDDESGDPVVDQDPRDRLR